MEEKKEYYLSEATRETHFLYGHFNSIIAPVGSGKTTYVGRKLKQEIEDDYDSNGLYVYLAPYTMLRDQVVAEGHFDKVTKSHELAMEGFILFDDKYTMQDISELENGKVAMTPHKFFRMIIKYPHIMSNINILVIDESDHVFCTLPQWERQDTKVKRENRVFEHATSIIMNYLDKLMVVGITATGGDNLRDLFGTYYNDITFKEKLKEYKPKSCVEYSNIKLAFNDAIKHGGKVAIFIESVRNMIKQREYFESIGYKVDMIVSDYAKNYTMNSREKLIKEQLAETGKSNLVGDILLFNSAMERGVSIHDKSFKSVIIHSSNEDTQTQVLGRFRFSGIRVWQLLPDYLRDRRGSIIINSKTGKVSNKIEVPNKYMEIPLTTEMKDELIKDIGFNKGWTTLKRELIENGYKVEDKRVRIEGKRPSVSIITK